MRAMWRGEISFGLVMIPIRLYAATEHRDVTFRQVHREDGGRIRFRRICSVDGEEVPYADVAKGYELPNGEMVVLTEDDMAELPLATAHGIEVLHFSPTEQVDPIMWERSYYTEPDPNGVRAYALLRDALERSGMVAVAKVALRQRESLAVLRVRDGVIVLTTLMWPDEIRVPDFEFLEEDVEVRSQELKMAASLIDSMTVDFDPAQYTDEYREALEELVEAKIEGHEVAALPGRPRRSRWPAWRTRCGPAWPRRAAALTRTSAPGARCPPRRASGHPGAALDTYSRGAGHSRGTGFRRPGARLHSGCRRPHHAGRRGPATRCSGYQAR